MEGWPGVTAPDQPNPSPVTAEEGSVPNPPMLAYASPAPLPGHQKGSPHPGSDTHPPPGVVVSSLPHPAPPDEMTARARVYLYSGVFRYAIYALFALAFQGQFAAATFIPIVGFVALSAWGWLFAITAATTLAGAVFRHRTIARIGLIMSAGVSGVLAAGLWIGAINVWIDGGKTTALFAATLTALVVKDLAVCTDPMKTPLELTALWRRAAAGGAP